MPIPFSLGGHASLYIAIFAALVVLMIASRLPVIGRLISLAFTLGLVAILALLLAQHAQFDPSFARIAQKLHLTQDQQVVGEVTRVPMARDGHFWAKVKLGGIERRMLIDSGATITAISADTAAAAGLDVGESPVPMLVRTANGTVPVSGATVPVLRIGNVVARDVPVVVSPSFGDMNVIGMNLLSRLKGWRVEDNVLILEPHHPQPGAA